MTIITEDIVWAHLFPVDTKEHEEPWEYFWILKFQDTNTCLMRYESKRD